MQELSKNPIKNVTPKIIRSREVIAKKWVAYQELTGAEIDYSQRTAAKILKIPRSTFQYWLMADVQMDELDAFFRSSVGIECLHKIVSAAHFVIQYRNCGVRGLQEFIQLSGLGKWVAHSTGTVHAFAARCENAILDFGKEQQKNLTKQMPRRKIALGEDETFHVGRPCLVAIELLSNYILVEEYAEQRRAEDWNLAVNTSLQGLNVEILSSTTDGGTALSAHVKNELGVVQASDLFHVQQDLSRATAGPLKAQERELEKGLEQEQKKLDRAIAKHGEDSEQAQQTQKIRNLKTYGLELRQNRRKEVKAAIKGFGQDYHPIELSTGKMQSAEEVKNKLEARIGVIEQAAKESELRGSCLKKITKAKEQIAPMVAYLSYFFLLLKQFLAELTFSPETETFFCEVLIPLAYLDWVYQKTPTKDRKALEPVLEIFKKQAREGPLQEKKRKNLQKYTTEVVRWFQRSSSCVEGRNGVLGMKHHGFHRLGQRRLSALTIVHNFHIRRVDGSSAAERFFQQKHEKLFDVMLQRVPMLGKPKRRRVEIQPLAA